MFWLLAFYFSFKITLVPNHHIDGLVKEGKQNKSSEHTLCFRGKPNQNKELKTLQFSVLEHEKVQSAVVNLKKRKSGNTLECTDSMYRKPNKLEAHAIQLTIYNTFLV